MYFDAKECTGIAKAWFGGIVEPWAGGLILGLQSNTNDEPARMFSLLRELWGWQTESVCGSIIKPLVLLIVLTISLSAFVLKLVVMLAILPLWLFIAVTASLKYGSPNYPQTWVSAHD